jgi:hypothetical protein
MSAKWERTKQAASLYAIELLSSQELVIHTSLLDGGLAQPFLTTAPES